MTYSTWRERGKRKKQPDVHWIRIDMYSHSTQRERKRKGKATTGCTYVEKRKISYFGLARKFNSTLNFTQSG